MKIATAAAACLLAAGLGRAAEKTNWPQSIRGEKNLYCIGPS